MLKNNRAKKFESVVAKTRKVKRPALKARPALGLQPARPPTKCMSGPKRDPFRDDAKS